MERTMTNKPIIFAICGPAASGKDTLISTYKKLCFKNAQSIMHIIHQDTTRPKRSQEEDTYNFKELSDINEQDYIVYCYYKHWFYGTPREEIKEGYNLGIFSPAAIEQLLKLQDEGQIEVHIIFIQTPFLRRFARYFLREKKISFEMIRRFISDALDFFKFKRKHSFDLILLGKSKKCYWYFMLYLTQIHLGKISTSSFSNK